MAKQPRVWTGTQWDTLAVTLPDLSNYSTTTQMNTAIDNAKGLVYITGSTFTNASEITFDNCFSSTYQNYRCLINITDTSTNNYIRAYFRSAVPADLTSDNFSQSIYIYTASVGGNTSSSPFLHQYPMSTSLAANKTNVFSLDIYNPSATTTRKMIVGTHFGDTNSFSGQSLLETIYVRNQTATAATGIKFSIDTGNVSGSIRIYGYRNS